MAKKITSYQKLKKKVAELEKDIRNLIEPKKIQDRNEAIMRYKLKYNIEKTIWFGNTE